MSFEAKIHEAQTKILRELLFLPVANFATLQKASGLESDHIKFHIKRLVELGYVQKVDGGYCLSVKGKEYANKLDTDAGVIERQPKVAVMLVIEREHDGEVFIAAAAQAPLLWVLGCAYWQSAVGRVNRRCGLA